VAVQHVADVVALEARVGHRHRRERMAGAHVGDPAHLAHRVVAVPLVSHG